MVRVTMIEGAPDEVVEVMNKVALLAYSGGALVAADEASKAVAPTVADGDKERVFAGTDFARRVLSRRPLSAEQREVLVLLAKVHPSWVPATDLQKAVKYSPAQFAGLMGAYGRRITHTEGFVEGSWFFDAEWDYDLGCYQYRLPDTVRDAVKKEGIA